jgi:hypothetical protein
MDKFLGTNRLTRRVFFYFIFILHCIQTFMSGIQSFFSGLEEKGHSFKQKMSVLVSAVQLQVREQRRVNKE